MEPDSGLLLILSDAPLEVIGRFNEWYDEDHAPARLAVPGIRTARRYRELTRADESSPQIPLGFLAQRLRPGSPGSVTYLTAYELDSLDVLESEAYAELSAGSPSALEIEVKRAARFDRRVYRAAASLNAADARSSTVCGEYLLCLWQEATAADESIDALRQRPGWLRVRRYLLDSGPGPDQLAIYDIESLDALKAIDQEETFTGFAATSASDGHTGARLRLFRLHRRFDPAEAALMETRA